MIICDDHSLLDFESAVQYMCCSSIFTLEQFVFELGQNSLNWYKIV